MASGGGNGACPGQGQTGRSGGKGQRPIRRYRQDGAPGYPSNHGNLTWQQQQMLQHGTSPTQYQDQPHAGRPSGSSKKKHHQGDGQKKTPHKRHQVWDPYWDKSDVQQGLKRGTLIEATVRINPKQYEDSFVPHPDGYSDVYICGMKNRNRALNGDIVVVQLDPRDQWKVLTGDIVNKEKLIDSLFQTNCDNPSESSANNISVNVESKKEVILDHDASVSNANDESVTTDSELKECEDKLTKLEISTPTNAAAAETNVTKKPYKKDQQETPKPHQSVAERMKHQQKREQSDSPSKKYTTLATYLDENCKNHAVRKLSFDEGQKGTNNQVELQKAMEKFPLKYILRTGKVVYISEKKHSRASSGTIKLMQDKNQNLALFCSTDSRFPRLMIPMEQCPKGFFERPDDHKNTLYIARMTNWKETSKFAFGELAHSLGEAGQIEPETAALLKECNVDDSEFSEECIKCLPTNLPWKIPQEELMNRRDLRHECIFTIDPLTARDLDDAVHCNPLADGMYEVGVHIADVSYFVKEKTSLDEVASDRATSVYLVNKVVPMLPRLLCEQLCSLNPDEDRLTFSVIWKIDQNGQILEEWFGRSIIRSCVKLAYEHAQGFIENPTKEWSVEELPPVSVNFTIPDIVQRVLDLNKIAVNLRKKRFDEGALRLDQVKIQFSLNFETGLPNGYSVYHQKDSNRLIEEFMLLANMAVAHKIYKTYPSQAFLRRHPPPQSKMIDDLEDMCEQMGVPVDASDAGSLQKSINRYAGDSLDAQARTNILTVLWSKPMQPARYFCSGMIDNDELFHHYALNVPLYTHFTSPIRRYADVNVHRLLAAALGYTEEPEVTSGQLERRASHCNDKKYAAKIVSEKSNEIFFSVFVKECGPIEEDGMVMGVLDHSFDVLILKLGVVKRVYTDKLAVKQRLFQKDHKKPILTLVWAADKEHNTEVSQTITIFTKLRCHLRSDNDALRWSAIVKHPGDIEHSPKLEAATNAD